jgi:hypothetical protein
VIFSLGGQDCDGDSVSEEPNSANDAEENSLTPEAKVKRHFFFVADAAAE